MHKKSNIKDYIYWIIIITLIIMVGVLQYFDADMPRFYNHLCGMIANLISISLAIYWGISIIIRISKKSIKINLIISAILIVFWLTIRMIKYNYFSDNDTGARYLWYAYYIPQLFVPVIAFISSINIEKRHNRKSDWKWNLFFIPSFVLIALIFTNDLHQLAFKFPNGLEMYNDNYIHNIVYFLAMAWAILMIFSFIVTLIIKCSIKSCRNKMWIPITFLIVAFSLTIYCFIKNNKAYKMPELISFIYIGLIEICISIGLIPSNTNHDLYFNASSVSAFITDKKQNIKYISNKAMGIEKKYLKMALSEPIFLNDNIELNSKKINGGNVFWTADFSTINSLNDKLLDISKQLEEENELIEAENELKVEKVKLEEQNRLYNYISYIVNSEQNEIKSILNNITDDNFVTEMKKACLIGVYIKRRSNLAIIEEKKEKINLLELFYFIKEQQDYLKDFSIVSSVALNLEKEIAKEKIELMFAFYEACIINAFPTLETCFVTIDASNNEESIRIALENPYKLIEKKWKRVELKELDGVVSIINQDDTIYLTLKYKEKNL